jgi:chemotaxis signal transduction protein
MEGRDVEQSGQFSANTETGSALTPSHCVFRHGPSWLALPAIAVREVLPQPDMVTVPGTPDTFAGLCHVRSEFIPVLNLDSVLSGHRHSHDQIMLILDDTDGPWAVLVDEVASLQFLEMSDAPESTLNDTQNAAIVGWAIFGETVIQVLDQSRIRQLAEHELSAMWQSTALLQQQFAGDGEYAQP